MEIKLTPIGKISTPFQVAEKTPIQSIRSDTPGIVEVYPEYSEGLDGVEEFSHLILVYAFHRAPEQISLLVKPFLDDRMHGIFATRYPVRPNPIGLSVVELVKREGYFLEILGVDMLDGTPLLDIKPYVPDFDIHQATKIGWYEKRARP